MKPDGVATAPAEPTEASATAEEAVNEEQPQEDQRSPPPQPEEPEHVQGADSTVPPPEKDTSDKTSQPKNKTKAPLKNNPGAAATKTGAPTRSAPAQSRAANGVARTAANGVARTAANGVARTAANGVARTAANGVARTAASAVASTAANGATRKPTAAASEMKKTAPSQAKKGPTAAALAQRTSSKAAERKPVGSARPGVTSTSSGAKPVAATTLSKKPAAAATSAVAKPKTTVSRPATAPAAKPSTSAASKTTLAPKATRPTTAPASSTTSSTSIRPTTTTTKTAASRTVSAPSAARSASLQPSKASTTTAATKKDVCKLSTSAAAARKPVATKTATNTQPTSTKASKPEPPTIPSAPAKRPPAVSKTTRLKTDDSRPLLTRPKNAPSRPTSSKMATATNIQKQGKSSSSVDMKHQTTKPTQSVLPLVKPTEEHAVKSVEPSSASLATVSLATEAAVVVVDAVPESEANQAVHLEEELIRQTSVPVEAEGDEVVRVPALEPSEVELVPTMNQVDFVEVNVQPDAETPVLILSNSAQVGQDFKEGDQDDILSEAPTLQEVMQPEPPTTPSLETSVAAVIPPRNTEVVEKVEQLIHNDAEEEEEEKEGSQQVSVSDMSGTQPTEESRPGSAGLAGSLWRAGGLLSELDSEDVSCSQQGASELSAPGVLEGTESMDDLGEASLKGADEGASAGSPDFEKVPEIPANEDDDDEDYDDEDRVCDMEVGSERTEDPDGQCHDNEDEDEDVEMASEGVTESGLESYGNADEDDFAEDYRLDNLNRMQPLPIVPSAPPVVHWDQANPLTDPWVLPLHPDPTVPSSPSSSPRRADSDVETQASPQVWQDVENATACASGQSPAHIPSSPPLAPVPSAEQDASFSLGLATPSQGMFKCTTTSDPEQEPSSSDGSTPEEVQDYMISPGMGSQQQPAPVNPVHAALPDLMQDLGIRLEHGDEEEEPETLPADDVLGGPTSVHSSPSSATEDEASDTEGEMQISEPSTEPVATSNDCFGSAQAAHGLSTLEEREEVCVETEGGGGSDTPQSATSAASYGFDCTNTSNSNAQSTTESCAKSPGIFSLENEEQLSDEAKDPSLIKELKLVPGVSDGGDELHLEQQGDLQLNSEQQYMLCGKGSEEPCSGSGTESAEAGFINPPSSQHQEEGWDLDAPHPYYSTISEKNDGSLAGRNFQTPRQQEVLTIHLTMSPKRCPRPHVDHVTNPPHLPIDLPPRLHNAAPKVQLKRLEHHQQQLLQIEKRREQQTQWTESCEKEREGVDQKEDRNQVEEGKMEREEKEKELEEQRRDLLHLQIQQQQQELKQRQQIMQWQQELEQQNQHQNKHKTVTQVLLSPSGLCTIYEALETSDTEDGLENEDKDTVMEVTVKYENSKELCSKIGTNNGPPKDNAAFPQEPSMCSLVVQEQVALTCPIIPESPPLTSSEQPSPLELDWGKKVDIVQQLINQTLLLAGDGCSPLLIPGGAGGTLSPLETSLWPHLLPPLTPPSATVTSVSSFSPEASGSSQGEWTVVELETHH